MTEILREKGVKAFLPKRMKDVLRDVLHCNGVIFAGRRRGSVDPLDVLNIALEFGKPIFLFGSVIGEFEEKGLKRLSTVLMSPKVRGFVTDEVSYRWVRLWADKRVETGVDVVHAMLIENARREKKKFAVFAPRHNGTLKNYDKLKWLPKIDTRVIVANAEDSKAAVKFSKNLETDEVVILSEPRDIIETVANAKFVVSERFYVSITAASFGVPFIHIGKKAERYFRKKLPQNLSSPDEIEVALLLSKMLEDPQHNYEEFNLNVEEKFEKMLKKLDEFLHGI